MLQPQLITESAQTVLSDTRILDGKDYLTEALNQPKLHEERIRTQGILREFYSETYEAMAYSRSGV